MPFLSVLFWAFFAAYVVHILDETLINGGFVRWIADNFWPTYHVRMFFLFNAAFLAAIAANNILFDTFGGHWVIIPIVFIAGFATHALTLHFILDHSPQHLLAGLGHELVVSDGLLSLGKIRARRQSRHRHRFHRRNDYRRCHTRRIPDRWTNRAFSEAHAPSSLARTSGGVSSLQSWAPRASAESTEAPSHIHVCDHFSPCPRPAIAASARFLSSFGVTCSLRLATCQRWPKGSSSPPARSP
jgi:hypothetical protein